MSPQTRSAAAFIRRSCHHAPIFDATPSLLPWPVLRGTCTVNLTAPATSRLGSTTSDPTESMRDRDADSVTRAAGRASGPRSALLRYTVRPSTATCHTRPAMRRSHISRQSPCSAPRKNLDSWNSTSWLGDGRPAALRDVGKPWSGK